MKRTNTLLASLVMTCVSVWMATQGNFFGWIGLIFFGGITILLLVKIWIPNLEIFNKSDFKSSDYVKQTNESFNKIYNDNGIFTYRNKGFSVHTTKGIQEIDWSEIKSMVGYKEDRYVTDCICLDVFCANEKGFKITEETPGWFKFLFHSKEAFPAIHKSWEIEISTPVFETNLTVVYDKLNRNLEEVITEFYSS